MSLLSNAKTIAAVGLSHPYGIVSIATARIAGKSVARWSNMLCANQLTYDTIANAGRTKARTSPRRKVVMEFRTRRLIP